MTVLVSVEVISAMSFANRIHLLSNRIYPSNELSTIPEVRFPGCSSLDHTGVYR